MGESMSESTASKEAAAPPRPPLRRDLGITVGLIALWLGLTLGSESLAPRIAAVVDTAEVAFGLDISTGRGEE